MKPNDHTVQQYLRLLIYGKYGSGKTTFCATAGLDPRSAPVFWINVGGNPQVFRSPRLAGTKVRKFDIDRIEDFQDIYNWFARGQNANEAFAKLHGLKPPYRTIVFDGYTGVQVESMKTIQGRNNFVPGVVPPKPSWDDRLKNLGQMVTIGSMFYELPDIHMIATALEHIRFKRLDPDDKESLIEMTEPALQGQTLDQLPGWALNVGRMCVAAALPSSVTSRVRGKPFTILQFERTQYVDAKDQHFLGPYHGDPTIGKMLDLLGWPKPEVKES